MDIWSSRCDFLLFSGELLGLQSPTKQIVNTKVNIMELTNINSGIKGNIK